MENRPALKLARGLLGLLVLLTLAGQVLEAERAPDVPVLDMALRETLVMSVTPGGAAERAGLRAGDNILSVGGLPVSRGRPLRRTLEQQLPGSRVAIEAARAGEASRTLPFVLQAPTPIDVAWRIALAVVGITTLLTGFLVFSRKTRALGAIFAGVCYGMGFLVHPPYVPALEGLAALHQALIDGLTLFIPPMLVHLFLLFPFRHPVLVRRSGLPWALYAPSLILLAVSQGTLLTARAGTPDAWLPAAAQALVMLLWVAGCTTALVLFVLSYRRAQTDTARAQVRVVLWGTLLGLFPVALVLLLRLVRPTLALPGERLSVLATVLVPLSFAYAIIRHGILDTTYLVRRSLVVTAGAGLIMAAYFLAYLMLQHLLLPVGVSTLSVSFLSMLVAALLFGTIRGRLRVLLRRVSGEERRERHALLYEFGRALGRVDERGEVVRVITDSLGEALQAGHAAFFEWTDDGCFEATYTDGLCAESIGRFRFSQQMSQALARLKGPTDRGDLEMDLPFGYLSRGDQEVLERVDSEVLIPVSNGRVAVAMVSIGGQVLGGVFTSEDLALAEAIAAEGGIALENAALHDRVRCQEQLRHEVDSAGDLQRRLLPAELPQVDAFEISGFSIPAEGVGGDYYDGFRTPWGEIVLAIGDAAGKSVSGAILMANLQALVRGEAQRRDPLEQIVGRLNQRLCDMRKPERYITLCLARIDPLTGTLAYCNAGHPSLMLVRADGQVEELTLGGLPLGIRQQAEYDSGTTYLRAGDVLLAYTDGISERQRGGEQFGVHRLQEIALAHRRSSVQVLEQAVLQAVRGFATTPLDDDTTLLLVKML